MTAIANELELGRALQALLDLGCRSVEIVPGTQHDEGEPADVPEPYGVEVVTPCGCKLGAETGASPSDVLKRARFAVETHLRSRHEEIANQDEELEA